MPHLTSHRTYDTIIIGIGAMGSAAAFHLSRRGKRVLGLEQFFPAHPYGSSHGHSRIIRQAYFEGSEYVPLLFRAYELWQQLERDGQNHLLTITGGLMIGSPDSWLVRGSLASARSHGIYHELLDAKEIHKRYPPLRPEPGTVGLFERMAGVLRPEAAILAHIEQATKFGATLLFDERVSDWEAMFDRVVVTTERNQFEAERLIISAGPWAPRLLAGLDLPLTIERQVLYWFDPVGGREPFSQDRFPVWIWSIADGVEFYGFPAQQEPGVKVALYHQGQPTLPETIDRNVAAWEIERMRETIALRVPTLNGKLVSTATCMYTTTPDQHFVLGLHPEHKNVIIASPCSGHGFKFASAIGEVLADLTTGAETNYPLALFSPGRFAR